MTESHIDLLASAVARRLASPSNLASLANRAVASPAGIDRLASAVARRLASPAGINRLASAVARRLGSPASRALEVGTDRIASDVARQIASAAPEARVPVRVNLASIDAVKLASTVTRRINEVQDKKIDPAEMLASEIVRRLIVPQIHASLPSASNFEHRVASTVLAVINKEKQTAPSSETLNPQPPSETGKTSPPGKRS